VIGVRFGKKFDTEIVDGKSEGGKFGAMTPETGRMIDRVVAKGSKVSAKLFVGKNGSLFETVHALADFDINVTLGVKVFVGKCVLIGDFLSHILAMNFHVLEYFHVTNKKEIFQVAGTVASTAVSIGDHTVEVKFGVDEANRRGSDVLIGVKEVASNSHADAPGFCLAWAHGANELSVSDLSSVWDLMRKDEKHGIVASYVFVERTMFGEALSAATPFVGE